MEMKEEIGGGDKGEKEMQEEDICRRKICRRKRRCRR